VVVIGGAGLGSAEGFALVSRLAAAFGGEWGATGDAIEAGWAPPEREVSVRGVTVRPDLYIGLGVGGNPEEVVAMQQSRLVLAVAADPQTTLFRWATWGVVAHPATFAEQLLARLT
jgi:electron transfer flavoprotein alpha subunit